MRKGILTFYRRILTSSLWSSALVGFFGVAGVSGHAADPTEKPSTTADTQIKDTASSTRAEAAASTTPTEPSANHAPEQSLKLEANESTEQAGALGPSGLPLMKNVTAESSRIPAKIVTKATKPRENPAEFKIKETPSRLELTTPYGERHYQSDFNLQATRHYRIEIPLDELRPFAPPEKAEISTPTVVTAGAAPSTTIIGMPGAESGKTVSEISKTEIIERTKYETDPNLLPRRRPDAIPDSTSEYDSTERLVLEANHLFNRGKYFEASIYVEELIRKHPEMVRAWVMKGSLLHVQGFSDLAKKAWAKAAEIDPEDPQVRDLTKRYP